MGRLGDGGIGRWGDTEIKGWGDAETKDDSPSVAVSRFHRVQLYLSGHIENGLGIKIHELGQ